MNPLASILFFACSVTAVLDHGVPIWKKTPHFRIEDAYKWTYQATRGGEHAVPDRESAANWLENEWRTMGVEPKGEREWVPLCPGGEIGRLNLRPFETNGGTANDLLDAFLNSAREYRGESQAFLDAWTTLGKRLKKKGFGNVTYIEWERLDAEMKKRGYPAIHHSKEYNDAMRPSYRIITAAQAAKILKH